MVTNLIEINIFVSFCCRYLFKGINIMETLLVVLKLPTSYLICLILQYFTIRQLQKVTLTYFFTIYLLIFML